MFWAVPKMGVVRVTATTLKNFESPYLHNGSLDPLHIWFHSRVIGVGGSNGPTVDCTKSKMASGRHLGKFRVATYVQLVIRYTLFFGSNRGFSGSTDRMVLLPVGANLKWH